MKRGTLRDHFARVAVKRLTAHETDPSVSHGHEIQATTELRRRVLGEVEGKPATVYLYLGDDEDGISVRDTVTLYDARADDPKRAPEWRLYYKDNAVTDAMAEGDSLFLAADKDGLLYFVVAAAGSTSERQLRWLFDLQPEGRRFVTKDVPDSGPEMGLAAHYVLGELGIGVKHADPEWLDHIIRNLEEFPKTAEFSKLARSTLPNVDAREEPDRALEAWLKHEEALFFRLERRLVGDRLKAGFTTDDEPDVEGFMKFSMGLHNRRKARMGYALENHLEAVFQAHDVQYTRGAITERRRRPDFLFPSVEAYRAGAPDLTMLGAKSSCKERWRQVLAEAEKIPHKHLLTLEPGITEPQTAEMQAHDLQLVVPLGVHQTYTDTQGAWLWNLGDFIRHVKGKAFSP